MADHPADVSIIALADDLSGAAETAYALSWEQRRARVELDPKAGAQIAHNTHTVLVTDLDCRHLSPADAGRTVRRALAAHTAQATLVFLKIDSLLRGNIAATAHASGDRPVVLAPALPSARRTVVDGVVHLDDVALHESHAWQSEGAQPPESIAAALAPLPCRTVPLEVVRSQRLRTWLTESIVAGETPVCDSVTDADLDAVVAATADLPGIRLAGSGGLAAALGRTFGPRGEVRRPTQPTGHGLLVVVGTAARGTREQLGRLRDSGISATMLDTRDDGDVGERVLAALAEGPTVLAVDDSRGLEEGRSAGIVRRLATVARGVVTNADTPVDLVLTGGETARNVLDALGVRTLIPIEEIHHGAVHSRTLDGTSVVTRPGSFGDSDSLRQIVNHLRPNQES